MDTSDAYKRFQRGYMVVYLLAVGSDWLQGPFIYSLYSSYKFSKADISKLDDLLGHLHQQFTQTSAVLLPVYAQLWFKNEWLSETFTVATFGNGAVAILSGLVADVVVSRMKWGAVAPFDLAAVTLVLSTTIIIMTWTENYGDSQKNFFGTIKNSLQVIADDRRIVLLGCVQALFEASMYAFIFLWTPTLEIESVSCQLGVRVYEVRFGTVIRLCTITMVDTRSGLSTSPYTQEQQEKMAALVRENKERKELLKQAKLKAIAEEQAAKMKELEEEMEKKKKAAEEEAAAEAEEERKRREEKGESSGTTNEEVAMEKKISGWIANLSLGEDEEAEFYVPQDERDALASELAAMEDPLERQEREEEKKLEWKLRMKREKKRRDEVNRLTAEVAKVKDCRQEVQAQADTLAKMDKVLGYREVLSAAWMEERQANRAHEVALSAMRSGFRDFARDLGEVWRLRDNVGKLCEGAIEGAKAVAAVESEGRPRKDPVKLKFPDAYGGKKEENFDNWEASVNSYVYLQRILTEEQVLVAFQALKDEAASFARSLTCAAGCENNLVAYSKVTPLPHFFKLLRERFADPTRGVRASDKLQTIRSRQRRSARALKGVMDDLVAVRGHGVIEPQLVQLFYRAMPEPLRGHFFDRSEQADITYDVLSREVVLFESKSMPVSTFWHKDLDKGKKWKGRTISGQVRAKDHMVLTLEEGGTDEIPYSEIEWGLEEDDSSIGKGRSYAAVAVGGRPQGRGGGQGQRGQAMGGRGPGAQGVGGQGNRQVGGGGQGPTLNRQEARTDLVIQKFFDFWVSENGVPLSIVSDRDSRFTSQNWQELMGVYGSKLLMSSGRHPETNGQTEQMNKILQQVLRMYIRPDQINWDEMLPKVASAYNNSMHLSTCRTPNELHKSFRPRRPFEGLNRDQVHRLPSGTREFAIRHEKELATVVENLKKAQHRMIEQANKHRRPSQFQVGDLVWVKSKEFAPEEHISQKLLPAYRGPWPVLEVKGGEDGPSYTIEFPSRRSMIPPDMDGRYDIDDIVDEDVFRTGGRGRPQKQYKVWFAYQEPEDDRWFTRTELLETAPDIFRACLASVLMSGRNRVAPEDYLRNVLVLAAVMMIVPALTQDLGYLMGCFLVYEICVGIFWPTIMRLRSLYLPEECRSSIMNMFRVPLNIFVVLILLKAGELDNRILFALCSFWLLLAAFCQQKLFKNSNIPSTGSLPESMSELPG
ncbi:hypothetical protein CBR_g24238 [Chara braunii]|uniref:Molybdate-anion transporter n=1 Tax=Chara braunii TaxID=69332 RepID=A0A388JM44_CHABU|nr:hypothetical protein CBR_g24238 [Chara braunii]|eukprot:GBG58886.1 hypothetical protein CBR_g24238 [Chara braunii]